MSRICVFTQTLLSGGAEKDAVLLANSLIEKHIVFLLVYYGDRIDEKLFRLINQTGVRLIKLTGSHVTKPFQLYRFLKKEKIEVLFSMLLLPNFLGGLIGRISGVKNPLGGIKSAKLDNSKIFLNRFLQNYINKLTVYNNYKGFDNYSKKGFNPEKAVVIPNSLETIPERIKRKKKELVTILSVGRFHPAKDYLTALKAIQSLKKENFHFRYQIVGYGELEFEIRKWIKNLELTDCVEIVINPSNLTEYYKNTDIFLMTSVFEGLSNAVLEAMSWSLPVVATRVGDMERVVIQGENGYLCNPKQPQIIAQHIGILINDFDKRIEFGSKSYELVKSEYAIDISGKRYLELIDKLLET